jgi:hypothetical protein
MIYLLKMIIKNRKYSDFRPSCVVVDYLNFIMWMTNAMAIPKIIPATPPQRATNWLWYNIFSSLFILYYINIYINTLKKQNKITRYFIIYLL